MNIIWISIFFISIIYGMFTGRVNDVSNAILNVPKETISLLITLVSSACFWNGMMSILTDVGFIRALSKKIRPLFKLIMPNFKDDIALDYMSTNIVSNMLGLGYGATPSGLKAIKRMQELNEGDKKEATNEMVTFLVLNTAGVTIIPTTVISIRNSLGSVNPSDMILLPVIATFLSCVVGLISDYYFRSHDK
jgi:spore maturation protein A